MANMFKISSYDGEVYLRIYNHPIKNTNVKRSGDGYIIPNDAFLEGN